MGGQPQIPIGRLLTTKGAKAQGIGTDSDVRTRSEAHGKPWASLLKQTR